MSEHSGGFPRTRELDVGITVDAGVADVVETCFELGLTPRASCSGLLEDHGPDWERRPDAYLSIQAAPTLSELSSRPPDAEEYRGEELVERLLSVADRAGWVAEPSMTFIIYPSVVMRLSPLNTTIAKEKYGVTASELSDEQKAVVEAEKETLDEVYNSLSDSDVSEDWASLQTELRDEFPADESHPSFDDNQPLFETIVDTFGDDFPGLEPSQKTQFPSRK